MLSVSIFFTGENQDGLNCHFTRPPDNVSQTITTLVNKPPAPPSLPGNWKPSPGKALINYATLGCQPRHWKGVGKNS